jgi:hypothetical protein
MLREQQGEGAVGAPVKPAGRVRSAVSLSGAIRLVSSAAIEASGVYGGRFKQSEILA